MNKIYLTDVVIRCSSEDPINLPDDARLFISVDDGKTTKRTAYFVKEPTGRSWRLGENIEVTENVPLTVLIITMEYPVDKFQRLGRVELIWADLATQCARQTNEVARALIKINDGPPLELVFQFVLLLTEMMPRVPDNLSPFFDDAIEAEDVMQRGMVAGLSGQLTPADLKRIIADVKFEHALRLSDDSTNKPVRLMQAADLFRILHQESHNNADLNKAISVYETAIRITPDSHQSRGELYGRLGMALLDRIAYSGDVLDIHAAICALECCLKLTPEGHPDQPVFLNLLGVAFARRFEHFGDLIDIDKAFAAHEQAVHLTPDGHDRKPAFLNNLGNSLHCRFKRSANHLSDIQQAIAVHEQALQLTSDGHAGRADCLSSLGNALWYRFKQSGDLADIDKAITAHEQALHLTPDGHADRPSHLSSLGSSYTSRFECSGDLADINKAIAAHEQALDLTPDGHVKKPGRLNSLGSSFLNRFDRSGDLADIEKAITAHEQALHLIPDGHADKPGHLSNLGSSFMSRFKRSGDRADIERAFTAYEQAVHLTPDGHADRPGHLNCLGDSFLRRFECSGDLIEIDKAITVHKQAWSLISNGHAQQHHHLVNLGNAFMCRFKCSGDLTDIEKAITAHEQAVHLTPDGHADKPTCLSCLGSSLKSRFERSRDHADIDKAITIDKQAMDFTPDGHADMPGRLCNLGDSFFYRFECSGDLVDIDKAIAAQEQALSLTTDGHASKPRYLTNLGTSVGQRFKRSGDIIDIEKSITTLEQAVHLTPDGHAKKSDYLKNLAKSFILHFEHSREFADITTAISHYQSAATCSIGSPSTKFNAALAWARLASAFDLSSAMQGYSVAFDLLPQVAWIGQTIPARHRELISMGNVASEAAAVAISAEEYDTGLTWLEQGRSIVWNQLLQLRTPVNALHEVQPILADELVHISRALEYVSSHNAGTEHLSMRSGGDPSMEEVAQKHRRLAKEWEMLVKKTRDIPGFEDFLQPKKLVQLRSAANAGTVVVINVNRRRCDALVLMPGLDEVMPIPLNDLSYEKAHKLHQALDELLSYAHVRARDTRHIRRDVSTQTGLDFSSILSDLWYYVVKPVLDCLAFPPSIAADPPRIWWCATGPLAFLPIHAAGIYGNSTIGVNISDYVISSYTPTLSALIKAAENHETRRKFQGLLAVTQPNTPGQSALPNTKVELTEIRRQARHFNVHVLEGPAASVESVIKGMEAHSWVHLACHAVQDQIEPTRSAFHLQDGHLKLSTIITKSFPSAEFAFLSACQTAAGDEKLAEEAVHLAASLMLAGYGSVIATMWSIRDEDAPIIAAHVYSDLFSETEPNSTKAAVALHRAVKVLRQQTGNPDFLSWVPFIHIGI